MFGQLKNTEMHTGKIIFNKQLNCSHYLTTACQNYNYFSELSLSEFPMNLVKRRLLPSSAPADNFNFDWAYFSLISNFPDQRKLLEMNSTQLSPHLFVF